jgi:hypothetical protein
MRQARAALLLISCGTTAGFHAPPARRRAPTTCAASILGELGTHLLALDFSGTHLVAFDFDSLRDSVLDARDSVLDAKDSVLDAKEAAADSVAQAKATALEQVETTKANAVGAVLKPIKEAKAALPPEVQNVIPEKVDLPKVSLPGSVPDLGELAEPAGPFAGRRRRGEFGGGSARSSFSRRHQGDVPDRWDWSCVGRLSGRKSRLGGARGRGCRLERERRRRCAAGEGAEGREIDWVSRSES